MFVVARQHASCLRLMRVSVNGMRSTYRVWPMQVNIHLVYDAEVQRPESLLQSRASLVEAIRKG